MRKKGSGPGRCFAVRLSSEEWAIVEKRIAGSACRSVSEYLRKVALKQPIRVLHRSQSLDELLQELIGLRKELKGVHAAAGADKTGGAISRLLVEKIWGCMGKIADHVLSNRL